MISVCINYYPAPEFTIHDKTSCRIVWRRRNRRVVQVTATSLGPVLSDFIDGKHQFAADGIHDDMWLDIALSTRELEESLVLVVQAILGRKYGPFEHAPIKYHEC